MLELQGHPLATDRWSTPAEDVRCEALVANDPLTGPRLIQPGSVMKEERFEIERLPYRLEAVLEDGIPGNYFREWSALNKKSEERFSRTKEARAIIEEAGALLPVLLSYEP